MLAFLCYARALLLCALAGCRCAACEAPAALETVFCPPCASSLVPLFGAPVHVRAHAHARVDVASFAYGGALREAIRRFKYKRRDDLARPLCALLLRSAPVVAACRPDRVVPVPLHPRRLAERGFDQSVLLARALASALSVPLVPRGLERVRDTEAQAGHGRAARLENLAGAFAVPPGLAPRLRGARIALVDDVCTTGATLDACAEALEEIGAIVVATAVLARA